MASQDGAAGTPWKSRMPPLSPRQASRSSEPATPCHIDANHLHANLVVASQIARIGMPTVPPVGPHRCSTR